MTRVRRAVMLLACVLVATTVLAAAPANTPMLEPQGTRDTTTFAIGPRFHFKFGKSIWFRPGVAFAMPLDNPMKKTEYKIVQLDLPVAF